MFSFCVSHEVGEMQTRAFRGSFVAVISGASFNKQNTSLQNVRTSTAFSPFFFSFKHWWIKTPSCHRHHHHRRCRCHASLSPWFSCRGFSGDLSCICKTWRSCWKVVRSWVCYQCSRGWSVAPNLGTHSKGKQRLQDLWYCTNWGPEWHNTGTHTQASD